MITYSKIGHFGRLGNQLFQLASTIGIARKCGFEVKFPLDNMDVAATEHFKDGKILNITFDVPKAFVFDEALLTNYNDIITDYIVNEQQFHFDESLFNISDNGDLQGYFQTDKYFKHIDSELRQLLTFKPHIQELANNLFPTVNGSTISIHVRRGDYVYLQQFHPTCTPEYYLTAAQQFSDVQPYFIIFSDDVSYCKRLFGDSENIIYINNEDPYIDLCLMSMCDHNIIANSSFSWWGAWLNNNKNKKVIAPKTWFGSAYSHNTVDLYCEDWILI